MSYRPITDTWILARSKVAYYGAYPGGFLERARALLGVHINDPVLHVCGGRARDYPYKGGFGPNDKTMDLDTNMYPDFHGDARKPFPLQGGFGPVPKKFTGDPRWKGILADPPYTEADADKYAPTSVAFPSARIILAHALDAVPVGGRVGILHYVAPRPPSKESTRFVALITVFVGFDNRARLYSVFERKK